MEKYMKDLIKRFVADDPKIKELENEMRKLGGTKDKLLDEVANGNRENYDRYLAIQKELIPLKERENKLKIEAIKKQLESYSTWKNVPENIIISEVQVLEEALEILENTTFDRLDQELNINTEGEQDLVDNLPSEECANKQSLEVKQSIKQEPENIENKKTTKDKIEKLIEEKKSKLDTVNDELAYFNGAYYLPDDAIELENERRNLLDEINESKEILNIINEIEKLEQKLRELDELTDYYSSDNDYAGPYYDLDQSEKEELKAKIAELNKMLSKENIENPEPEPEPEPDPDPEPEPKLAIENIIEVDLNLNKKTGECLITSENFSDVIKMNALDYTQKCLKKFHNYVIKNQEISEEDKDCIKNIDPTLYKAYSKFDKLNPNLKDSMAKMYVNAVIEKSRAIEQDKDSTEVKLPGKVNVDVGWHPGKKDLRGAEESFKKLKNILASFRANKILKKHGEPGIFSKNRLDIAKVSDNRKLMAGIIGAVSMLGAIGGVTNLTLDSGELAKEIEISSDKENDIAEENQDLENKNETKEDVNKNNNEVSIDDKKENKSRIYLGDLITAEQYSALYKSASGTEPNGALNKNSELGVNKIACVIDGVTYTTKEYSADEIYEMAENANVNVRYHVDRATEINGKICVQVNEVDNPSPIYIYNDNGTVKRIDGEKWGGDVEYSSIAGWMKQDDVEKSDDKKIDNVYQSNRQEISKTQENGREM